MPYLELLPLLPVSQTGGSDERHEGDQRERTAEAEAVEEVIAPTAIERALSVYQQLNQYDQSDVLQARTILRQHIYGMVDQGEHDMKRLVVGGLARLKGG
jgi:hypothetical protein